MKKEIKKVEVCCGEMCMRRGADEIFETLQKDLQDDETVVHMCNCLGRCHKGPNILVDENSIIHYNKPRTVTQRVKEENGVPFIRYNEDNLGLEEDYLGDLK